MADIVFFAFITNGDNAGSWRTLARQTFLNPANVRCLREESASYRFYVSSLHLQTGPDSTHTCQKMCCRRTTVRLRHGWRAHGGLTAIRNGHLLWAHRRSALRGSS